MHVLLYVWSPFLSRELQNHLLEQFPNWAGYDLVSQCASLHSTFAESNKSERASVQFRQETTAVEYQNL